MPNNNILKISCFGFNRQKKQFYDNFRQKNIQIEMIMKQEFVFVIIFKSKFNRDIEILLEFVNIIFLAI